MADRVKSCSKLSCRRSSFTRLNSSICSNRFEASAIDLLDEPVKVEVEAVSAVIRDEQADNALVESASKWCVSLLMGLLLMILPLALAKMLPLAAGLAIVGAWVVQL